MGNGAETAGGGFLNCSCFHLPSRSKKKPAPAPPVTVTTKLRSASRRSSVAPDASVVSQSQRVTFLASASLSTWWPSSPSASGAAAPVPASGGGNVAPRRASASAPPPRNVGVPRASSSSFSYWRRSLSSQVMPASARASFSFPTSPASASSSCMSTPKIPNGCQQ